MLHRIGRRFRRYMYIIPTSYPFGCSEMTCGVLASYLTLAATSRARFVMLFLSFCSTKLPLSSPFHFKVISLTFRINVIKHIYFIVLILKPGTDMRVLGLFRGIMRNQCRGRLFLDWPSRDRCQSGMDNWPLTLADGKTTLRNGSCSAMSSYFVPVFPTGILFQTMRFNPFWAIPFFCFRSACSLAFGSPSGSVDQKLIFVSPFGTTPYLAFL